MNPGHGGESPSRDAAPRPTEDHDQSMPLAINQDSNSSEEDQAFCSRTTPTNHPTIRRWHQMQNVQKHRNDILQPITIQTTSLLQWSCGPHSAPSLLQRAPENDRDLWGLPGTAPNGVTPQAGPAAAAAAAATVQRPMLPILPVQGLESQSSGISQALSRLRYPSPTNPYLLPFMQPLIPAAAAAAAAAAASPLPWPIYAPQLTAPQSAWLGLTNLANNHSQSQYSQFPFLFPSLVPPQSPPPPAASPLTPAAAAAAAVSGDIPHGPDWLNNKSGSPGPPQEAHKASLKSSPPETKPQAPLAWLCESLKREQDKSPSFASPASETAINLIIKDEKSTSPSTPPTANSSPSIDPGQPLPPATPTGSTARSLSPTPSTSPEEPSSSPEGVVIPPKLAQPKEPLVNGEKPSSEKSSAAVKPSGDVEFIDMTPKSALDPAHQVRTARQKKISLTTENRIRHSMEVMEQKYSDMKQQQPADSSETLVLQIANNSNKHNASADLDAQADLVAPLSKKAKLNYEEVSVKSEPQVTPSPTSLKVSPPKKSDEQAVGAQALEQNDPCALTTAHLVENTKVLLRQDVHFYVGAIREIIPPDVYGVTLEGERGNKPHILSREELLKEGILCLTPSSKSQLRVGSRVCVYWSSQYTYLFPGTIDDLSPDHKNPDLVHVTLDDSDHRDIHVKNVRMLPNNYPVIAGVSLIGEQPNWRTSRRSSSSIYSRLNHTMSLDEKSETTASRLSGTNENGDEASSSTNSESSISNLGANWKWLPSPKDQKSFFNGKKIMHGLVRGSEILVTGDSVVLRQASPQPLPYVGKLKKMWETEAGDMVIDVQWYYHEDEVRGLTKQRKKLRLPGGVFLSTSHYDINEVVTILHKCDVSSFTEFSQWINKDPNRSKIVSEQNDRFYLAGSYDQRKNVATYSPDVQLQD